MIKVVSWVLFILTIAIFLFDIYFAVAGTIEVKLQLDRIEAMGGGSGVDFFGVGVEVLVFGLALITFVGFLFSILSAIFAQRRVIRIISFVFIILFVFVPFFSLLCVV